ncbi:MAG: hypothetical protein A2Y82_03450 [Candidatus Buchananbacteria bacterium RBG_13_36_9]|uniref:HTH cro/C1-type domain-containing protein n=1 Tax=Candidatus Buchananbacteria bacterium RBG_13_36_9 TaxID=1797530 RepID=A0A1G1XLJ0_9BACT|nr:MAG: hypothetical protein A2Y82_03450 [Candidatus Buchananbacteria bacterium RBG_13_36_9]
MNKKIKKNPIAEARKHPKFKQFSEEAEVKIKLGIEIYDARNENDLSQQELAKLVGTTQKVISKIENAEVNAGINLLQRISRILNLNLQIGKAQLVTSKIFFNTISLDTIGLEAKGQEKKELVDISSRDANKK